MQNVAMIRSSLLKLNYDCEYKNRIRAGDDVEIAEKAAELAVLEITTAWEEQREERARGG